jgi:Z1 domain
MIQQAFRTLISTLDSTQTLTQPELEDSLDLVLSFSRYKKVDRNQLRREVEAWIGITAEDYTVIADEQHHKSWLPDKKSEIQWHFWGRYHDYLKEEKRFGQDPLRRLDSLTDDILNRLFNPMIATAIDKRGLVVGQVQSGKTSNYSGLICKAADAGFKIIIVMAGIHNNLRSQTQLRIDEGFLGFDTQISRSLNNDKRIGVGKIMNAPLLAAHSLTSSKDEGDFSRGIFNSLGISFDTKDPIILVVKKNTSVLKLLYDWLASNALYEKGVQKTIDSKALLMIDDEADHASINTSKKKITRINQRIRSILTLFSRSAYVGYTATPFANIFIPIDDNDLFPKDFIVNLPAPSNYIGPEKVFGYVYDPDDHQIPNGVLPIIHSINDYETCIPDKHKKEDGLPTTLPPSLKLAIKSFIMTCAVRRARQQETEHNSMLVHVTRYTNWQNRINQLIDNELGYYQRGIDQNDMFIIEELRQVFETDTIHYKSFATTTQEVLNANWKSINLNVKNHDWETILLHLHAAAAKITVKTVNGGSADVLNYFDEPKGISVIVVGGDKLSRGLTLEGLSISYYLRASKMYDTLMQMGRWFGYRPGYVDLCRLFTSDLINEWYCHIALASNELREEFDYMKDVAGATPKDFALKVRTHPSVLQITASNKMRNAIKWQFTFSGHLVQTYLLKKDRYSIKENLRISERFINQLNTPEKIDKHKILWRTRNVEQVISFLSGFQVHNHLRKAHPQNLVNYIKLQREVGELTEWVIAIPLIEKGESKTFPFTIGDKCIDVQLIKRAHQDNIQKNNSEDCYFVNRGNLLSPRDEFFDLDVTDFKGLTGKKVRENQQLRPSKRALLLLYPLNPKGIVEEKDLPIMGVAISFPKSTNNNCVEYAINEHVLDQFKNDDDYYEISDDEYED